MASAHTESLFVDGKSTIEIIVQLFRSDERLYLIGTRAMVVRGYRCHLYKYVLSGKQEHLNMITKRIVNSRTHFNDLPDEILLIICHYLSPADVLKAFLTYDKRLFSCIFKYHQNINLTKWSWSDLKPFMLVLAANGVRPSTLTVSNIRIPTQIEMFFKKCCLSLEFSSNNIHHLSLLECTNSNFSEIDFCLTEIKSLESLHIVQSISDEIQSPTNYLMSENFRQSIFNSFDMLIELELTINDGIILDKQICSNKHLKKLIISLKNINDLYILIDGLVPNLTILHVTICQSNFYKRSSVPRSWPNQFMCQLMEFQLIINDDVPFTFDQLRNIVMPLIQLNKLTLIVKNWINDNNQLDILIDQFMPKLNYLYCSIKTTNDINIETFATLNKRWPIMICCLESNNKHLYTIPWSFQHLHISMLANDDISVCRAVQSLIVDTTCTNLSYRFPKIHTLTILSNCNLSQDNFIGFRQLRHLTITNINIVPSSVIQNIHTLTLTQVDDLLNHPIIYSNLKYLTVKNNEIDSFTIIIALVKHFPNLHSLAIKLKSNGNYYDNLDVLLNDKFLPYLSLLQINFITTEMYCSNINLWLTDNTILKWRTTPFYVYRHQNDMIICF